jgi:hypothetical protein
VGAHRGQGVGRACPGAAGERRQKPAGRGHLGARRQAPRLAPCWRPRQAIQGLLEGSFSPRAAAPHVPGGVGQRQTPGREARAVLAPPGAHWPQGPLPCGRRAQRRCAPPAAGAGGPRPPGPHREPLGQRDRVLRGSRGSRAP